MTIDDILFTEKNMKRGVNKQCAMFEHMINKIKKSKSLSRRLKYAKEALNIANHGSTRYYSSDVIEDVFIEIAQNNSVSLSSNVIPDSVLHVASELYETGGHTRILERWIENAPPGQKNSLFLTRNTEIPNTVKMIVSEHNGEIIIPDKSANDIERALQLRKIASQYERIILHIHMDDYIPIIAFGTNDFTRPVYLFNHADHRFWIGVSIADCVISFRDFGREIAEKYRGVKNSFYMPLIIESNPIQVHNNITKLKQILGIPINRPIVFTSGSAQKFRPLLNMNFNTFVNKLINRIPNIMVVAIGPTLNNVPDKNIINLSVMPHDKFIQYLNCADVVIDSFPFSGGTALLDAVSATKPVLSLKCPTGQLNYITKSIAYCDTVAELIKRTCELIKSTTERKNNLRDVKKHLVKEDLSVWVKQRDLLYTQNVKHRVNKFHSVKKPIDILDYFMYQNTCEIKRKLHIPYLFDVFRIMHTCKKHYAVIRYRMRLAK